MIRISGSMEGSKGSGYLVSISTVPGSIAVTLLIERVNRPSDEGELGTAGARSNDTTTSSAVSKEPSENFTFGRSLISHVVSFFRVQEVANAGARFEFASNWMSASKKCRATALLGELFAKCGSSEVMELPSAIARSLA